MNWGCIFWGHSVQMSFGDNVEREPDPGTLQRLEIRRSRKQRRLRRSWEYSSAELQQMGGDNVSRMREVLTLSNAVERKSKMVVEMHP